MEAVIRRQVLCCLIFLNRVDVGKDFRIENVGNYRLGLARNEMEGKSMHACLELV